MTTATVALAKKGADIDVLRQLVQFTARRLMDRVAHAPRACRVTACFGRCKPGLDDASAEPVSPMAAPLVVEVDPLGNRMGGHQ